MDWFTLMLLGSSRLSQEHMKHGAVAHAERRHCSRLATESSKHPWAGEGDSGVESL